MHDYTMSCISYQFLICKTSLVQSCITFDFFNEQMLMLEAPRANYTLRNAEFPIGKWPWTILK